MSKTDNQNLVGVHKFEAAGLGKAPFRFVGLSENAIKNPDGSSKAGGCCAYCFTGIRYECHVVSTDGKRFVVGSDCINKVDDSGLYKAYKNSPEVRQRERAKRQEKGRIAFQVVRKLIDDNRAFLASLPHPRGFVDRETNKPLTYLDQVEWVISNCGISGITSYAKHLPAQIEKLKTETANA